MPPVVGGKWPKKGHKGSLPGLNFTLQQHGNSLGRSFQEGLQEYTEDRTVQLGLTEREIQLPSNVKSTFLMIFSPDGEKVASTHGDHLIRISCVRTSRVIRILQGHKRTPWCLAFHPTLHNVIASGCLSGKVRVWDLRTGEFEEWSNPRGETAIASLAFHPSDRVILIATCNELHFWDWSHDSDSFLTLTTASDLERVRYVKFDPSGSKIVTGISNRPPPPTSDSYSSNPLQRHSESFDSAGPAVPPFGVSGLQSNYSNSSLAQLRRSQLITRVLSIYRQLESMIDVTLPSGTTGTNSRSPQEANATWDRYPGRNGTSSLAFSNAPQSQTSTSSSTASSAFSSPSTSASSSSPLISPTSSASPLSSFSSFSSPPSASALNASESAVLVSTFRRLHALCTRLAQHVQEQDSLYVRRESGQSSLVEMLSRLEQSLRDISAAPHASSEHMHRVHQRVTEILERMANVTSYRERLSSLRYQISDVAENDSGASQRMDLIHCIWLIDVSLYLTRQMTRILEADYRITQSTLGPLSSHNVANANSSPINLSNSSQRFQPYQRSHSGSNFQFNIPLVRVSGPEPDAPEPLAGQNGTRHLWFQHWGGHSAVPGHEFMNSKGTYRLQCWDFSRFQLPDLKDTQAGLVVSKCRIHNDASVDINSYGTLLASLVPDDSLNSQSISLHIYSLEKSSFAQCLFSWTFGANAISVSLSPISRYVVVGFNNARSYAEPLSIDANDSVTVGQVFRLTNLEKDPVPRCLHHVRNINIARGDEHFNLNSIRWLPHPGQGFIYGTSRGHMVICQTTHHAQVESKPKAKTLSIGTQTTPS